MEYALWICLSTYYNIFSGLGPQDIIWQQQKSLTEEFSNREKSVWKLFFVSLQWHSDIQTFLYSKNMTLFIKFNIAIYFKILIIRLRILYTFNTHIKFCINWMLFTIWFITYFLCIILNYKNLQFKQLIDNIIMNLWYSENFVSIKYVKRKYNLKVNLSKFISNKKIFGDFFFF